MAWRGSGEPRIAHNKHWGTLPFLAALFGLQRRRHPTPDAGWKPALQGGALRVEGLVFNFPCLSGSGRDSRLFCKFAVRNNAADKIRG